MWTRRRICGREAEMRKLLRSNIDDPEVRAHAVNCAVCRETLAVGVWMQKLADLPIDTPPLPNPTYLWWKAQVLRRWDAERQANAPMDVGEQAQVGIGLAGAMLLLVWLWRQWQPLATSATVPPSLTVVMIASGVLVAITALVAARQLMARD